MFTKSFDDWLDEHEYAWLRDFNNKQEIVEFISQHLQRGTRIGKVLSKMKLDFSLPKMAGLTYDFSPNPAEVLQKGVIAFNAREYVAKVELVSDTATVSEAYKNIRSCMTKCHEDMAQFLTDDLLIEQGIRLAVYRHKDEVVGRCIVNTTTQGMLPIYSSVGTQEFGVALQELGYLPDEYTKGVFVGTKLPWSTCNIYFDETGGSFTMYRIVDEEWWFISELDMLVDGDEGLSPTNQGHISLLENERFQRNIQELSEEAGFEIDPRKLELLDREIETWIPLLIDEIPVEPEFVPTNHTFWPSWYEQRGRRLWYHCCARREGNYHLYGYMDDFGDLQVTWVRQDEVAN